MMAEAIVQDWLSEYASLQPSEMDAFVSMHENNQEIAEALYTIFNERLKYPELLHSVCNQFYSFYRSNEERLKRFTMQFIPILIYIYLNSVAMGDKKSCRSVETLLISIYNVEVSTEDGYQKVVSFRMPVLAQASIYHEEKSLHAVDLRRWEENSNRDVKWGPMPQIESINAQNRMNVMTALLFSYNQQLCLIQKSALFHLCRISSQIVNQGFSKPGHAHRSSYGSDPTTTTTTSSVAPKPLPRILLSSSFLLELVHAIYFAMFNGFGTIAIQTLEDIHHRACYEMFTDSILVTNAVRNSLHSNPSGQPSDGPMGLSVALTPATNTVTVSKSMITNASFRTKKLPDDIPIQGAKDDIQQQTNNTTLTSITEENEQQIGNRNVGVRSSKEGSSSSSSSKAPHKALIAGFKKSKDKDREKESKNNLSLINKNNNNNNNNNNNGGGGVIMISSNNEMINISKESSLSSSSGIIGTSSSQKQLLNKKTDKFTSRNSIQMNSSADSGGGSSISCGSGGASNIVNDYEKSPLPNLKNKMILDVISSPSSLTLGGTTTGNTSEIVQFQLHNLTNGSESDRIICENNFDSIVSTVAASTSSAPVSTVASTATIPPAMTAANITVNQQTTSDIPTITKRPSLVAAMEDTLHIQISQV